MYTRQDLALNTLGKGIRKMPRRTVRAAGRHTGAISLAVVLGAVIILERGDGLWLSLVSVAVALLIAGLARPSSFEHVLRRRSRLLNALVGSALCVAFSIPLYVRSEFQDVARLVIAQPTIARGATVFVVKETFAAGSELVIEPDLGETIRVRLEAESFFAIVDDAPGERYEHPVHYAIVSRRGIERVMDHDWLPTVNGLRWRIDDEIDIDGHAVIGLTNVDWPLPQLELRVELPRPAVADAAGRKIALVIDGGAKQRDWRDRFARKLDEDTLAVADALTERGYDVRRFGGYKGTVVPSARVDDVRREIARIANEVGPGDEVVLFMNGHGGNGGFALFDRTGSRERLSYSDLGAWLADVPLTVPVHVVIDACRSGSAVEALSRRDNTIVSTATDDKSNAPGGLGAQPTFSAVIAAAAKDKVADLDGDGSVGLGESLAVAGNAFATLGSRLVATPGAPRIPTAGPAGGAIASAPTPRPTPPSTASPLRATPAPTQGAATSVPTLVPGSLPPAAAALRFVASAPPVAVAGQRFTHSFCDPAPATATSACGPFPQTTQPTGGSPPYHFQLGSGVGFPPIGVSLGKDGILTGTPSTPGTYVFEVCAVDLSADQACQRVTMTVTSAQAVASPTPVRTAAPAPTPSPALTPTRGTLASKSCAYQSGSGTFTYYRVTLSGTVSGGVGARVAFVNSTMTCAGWTPFGPDCRRTADSQPSTIQWSATAGNKPGGVDLEDLWFDGPTGREIVKFRCP